MTGAFVVKGVVRAATTIFLGGRNEGEHNPFSSKYVRLKIPVDKFQPGNLEVFPHSFYEGINYLTSF